MMFEKIVSPIDDVAIVFGESVYELDKLRDNEIVLTTSAGSSSQGDMGHYGVQVSGTFVLVGTDMPSTSRIELVDAEGEVQYCTISSIEIEVVGGRYGVLSGGKTCRIRCVGRL